MGSRVWGFVACLGNHVAPIDRGLFGLALGLQVFFVLTRKRFSCQRSKKWKTRLPFGTQQFINFCIYPSLSIFRIVPFNASLFKSIFYNYASTSIVINFCIPSYCLLLKYRAYPPFKLFLSMHWFLKYFNRLKCAREENSTLLDMAPEKENMSSFFLVALSPFTIKCEVFYFPTPPGQLNNMNHMGPSWLWFGLQLFVRSRFWNFFTFKSLDWISNTGRQLRKLS